MPLPPLATVPNEVPPLGPAASYWPPPSETRLPGCQPPSCPPTPENPQCEATPPSICGSRLAHRCMISCRLGPLAIPVRVIRWMNDSSSPPDPHNDELLNRDHPIPDVVFCTL